MPAPKSVQSKTKKKKKYSQRNKYISSRLNRGKRTPKTDSNLYHHSKNKTKLGQNGKKNTNIRNNRDFQKKISKKKNYHNQEART